MAVKFGIVGCGYIGKRHALHIVANPEAKLVCVYDIKPDRATSLANEYGAKTSNSLSELLSQVDVVSICTPNGEHFNSSLQALKSGLHVLIEKPITLRSQEARILLEESERQNRE